MSTQSTVCIIITIVLYLLFMLYLGFRFTNANQSVGDFYPVSYTHLPLCRTLRRGENRAVPQPGGGPVRQ